MKLSHDQFSAVGQEITIHGWVIVLDMGILYPNIKSRFDLIGNPLQSFATSAVDDGEGSGGVLGPLNVKVVSHSLYGATLLGP